MYAASQPSKRSRVDIRYRHQAQDVLSEDEIAGKRSVAPREKEEEVAIDRDDPLLKQEQEGKANMGRAHRIFHRRQEPSNILTVPVEVVASVDAIGNTVIEGTQTLPVNTAIPTIALPSVPAVPPFPTDLVVPSVPAFPFPSGVPSLSLTATITPTDSLLPPTTTAVLDLSSTFPTFVASGIGYNSTSSSTISSSSSSSSSFSSSSSSSSSSTHTSSSQTSSSRSSTSASSTRSSSSRLSTQSSSSSPLTTTWSSAPTSTLAPVPYGGGGGDPGNNITPATETIAADSNSGTADEPPTIGTPRIVGSVIGSLAGTAILLWLILFLLKRHKRKGTLQLSGGDAADSQPIASSGQQMATRNSFVPTGVPSFLNRFSGASRSTIDSSTGERGFQRISGRKLPSAFSEGMTSDQFTRGQGTLSGASFYRDDHGFYGGPGVAAHKEFGNDFGKETGGPSNYGTIGAKERIMPSPARTPVVHYQDDAPAWGTSRNGGSTLSPPHSPNPDLPLRSTLGRSHPSHDGSRSSRFTENV